jgi:hypothetical protein
MNQQFIFNNLSYTQEQATNIFYLKKEKVDRDVNGYNFLSILEESFPKTDKKDYIFINLKKQHQINTPQYIPYLQYFIGNIINMGYSHLMIETV